jgi:TonB-dependent SusC/RagA subfamily outer membrane receptor
LPPLRLGRFTVDSSVTPARRRIIAEGAPGGGVYFPIEDNIQSVEVLKGRRAIDFYGDDAANGVIVVTTKRASVPRGR